MRLTASRPLGMPTDLRAFESRLWSRNESRAQTLSVVAACLSLVTGAPARVLTRFHTLDLQTAASSLLAFFSLTVPFVPVFYVSLVNSQRAHRRALSFTRARMEAASKGAVSDAAVLEKLREVGAKAKRWAAAERDAWAAECHAWEATGQLPVETKKQQ